MMSICRICKNKEPILIPRHWKKGNVCFDCNRDLNRIANRKSRMTKKYKRISTKKFDPIVNTFLEKLDEF